MIRTLLVVTVTLLTILSCAGPSPRYPDMLGGKSHDKTKSTPKKSKTPQSKTEPKKSSTKSQKIVSGKSYKRSELEGKASWYGPGFQAKKTASGERFNMYDMTAAHKTLPFGTVVEVTEVSTGKKVKVRINDRGPFAKGRVIDLSKKAAQKLGIIDKGFTKVKLRIIK